MSWDWEKLKQQQGGRGGIPPQVDEMLKLFKKFRSCPEGRSPWGSL